MRDGGCTVLIFYNPSTSLDLLQKAYLIFLVLSSVLFDSTIEDFRETRKSAELV